MRKVLALIAVVAVLSSASEASACLLPVLPVVTTNCTVKAPVVCILAPILSLLGSLHLPLPLPILPCPIIPCPVKSCCL